MQDTLKFKVAVSFFLGWGQFMSVAFKKKIRCDSVRAEQTPLWIEAVHSWWSILSWKQTAFSIPVNLDEWTRGLWCRCRSAKGLGGGGGGHLQCCRQRKWALPILHSVAAGGGGRASPQGRLSELSGSIRSRVPFQGCGPVARATHLSGRLSPRSFLKLPPCHPPSPIWPCVCTVGAHALLHVSRF